MITDYFDLALRNIKKRSIRSSLTIIGIVISIATLFTLVSLSLGLQYAVEEQFRLLGTDKFFVQPRGQLAGPGSGGAVQLTEDDVKVIEHVAGVKDLSYFVAQSAEISYDGEKRFTMVIGFPLDKSRVMREQEAYKASEGRLLDKGDNGKAMVGSQWRDNSFFKRAVRTGNSILIAETEFKVISVLKSTGSPSDDKMAYIPLEDFKKLFNSTNRVDSIMVQVNPGQNIQAIAKLVEKRLRSTRGVTEKTQDFTVLTPEELLSSFGNVLSIITGFLLGVATISLLVGGIGITNTMYTSVLERTREIGIMKAVGARNQDILLLFLIEAGLLGLVGGVIGVGMGAAISKGIEIAATKALATTLLQALFPVYLWAGSLIFAFLVGAIAGVIPAKRASGLKPVEALRYE
jgi:putative ABC transport system permease protein